jgi:hypothetical protein
MAALFSEAQCAMARNGRSADEGTNTQVLSFTLDDESQKTPLGSEDGDAAREENAAAASACELAVAAARTIPEPFGQSDRVPDGHERAVESAHEIASLLHEWRAKVLEDTGTLPPGFVRCTSRYVGALVRKRLGEVTREEAILRKDLATLDVGTEEQTTI